MASFEPQFPQDYHGYSAQRLVSEEDMEIKFMRRFYEPGELRPLWSTPFNDVREVREYDGRRMSHLDWMRGHQMVSQLHVAKFELVSVDRIELLPNPERG